MSPLEIQWATSTSGASDLRADYFLGGVTLSLARSLPAEVAQEPLQWLAGPPVGVWDRFSETNGNYMPLSIHAIGMCLTVETHRWSMAKRIKRKGLTGTA